MAEHGTSLEITEFVVEECDRDTFELALKSVLPVLTRQPGVLRVHFGRAMECDESFFLLVCWKRLADHEAFRRTADFTEFASRFRPLMKKPARVVHIAG